MVKLSFLAPSRLRFHSELHPFYIWKKQLRESGIESEIYYDHKDPKLKDSEVLILHHRYFDQAEWKNSDPLEDRKKVIDYIKQLKKGVGKLIWFDAQDSSGTTHFSVIPYVDIYAKKQVLKDKDYYTDKNEQRNVRIWIDPSLKQKEFDPCPAEHLHKIKVSWNLAFNDYRYFNNKYKLHYLSNFIGHKIYPIKFSDYNRERDLDLTFRGKMTYDKQNLVAFQRNKVIGLLNTLNYKTAHGKTVSRFQYLKELSSSKVSISPFGYGEICYRDFETFIAGSILIKPSMEHLITYPNVFIANETYLPITWNLDDLEEKLELTLSNYHSYKQIAQNGQELYRKVVSDPQSFIQGLKNVIEG